MTRCLVLATVILFAVGGCRGAVVQGDGSLSLAAVDPALLENARLLVFSFTTTQSCADLVDRSPRAMGEQLADEDAPVQAVENGDEVSHVFGEVPADVPASFVVLASSAARDELGQRIDLADLSGTVFAAGCRDYRAQAGTRVDLPVTLFPIGLR
ncbi:MAG: hypothetical protein IT383_04845 [Deltaproteobacteria bacterium]|nr:hypothetical protein [Deltaproteobacteria bacterium]